MLVVPEVEDVYTPLPSDLIVPLEEAQERLQQLLESVPQMFAETRVADSCLGAALQGAFLAMKKTGGRILAFQFVTHELENVISLQPNDKMQGLCCVASLLSPALVPCPSPPPALPSAGIGSLLSRESTGRASAIVADKDMLKLLKLNDKQLTSFPPLFLLPRPTFPVPSAPSHFPCSFCPVPPSLFLLPRPTFPVPSAPSAVLPSVGIGSLSSREAEGRANATVADKDVLKLLQPNDKQLRPMAEEMADFQVAVDVFLTSQGFTDVASIAVIPRITGGQLYSYYPFSAAHDGGKLHNDLRWAVRRPHTFEGVMKVRCSQGLSVSDYFGNFHRRIPAEIYLPAMDSDKAIMATVKHDEKLAENSEACFQCAILYTTTTGERRVRVHTLSLPTTASLASVFRGADLDAQFAYMLKTVHTLSSLPPPRTPHRFASVFREADLDAQIAETARFASRAGGSAEEGRALRLARQSELCPAYPLPIDPIPHLPSPSPLSPPALLKSQGLRGDVKVDERSAWLARVRPLAASLCVPLVYPRLFALHHLLKDAANQDAANHVSISTPLSLPLCTSLSATLHLSLSLPLCTSLSATLHLSLSLPLCTSLSATLHLSLSATLHLLSPLLPVTSLHCPPCSVCLSFTRASSPYSTSSRTQQIRWASLHRCPPLCTFCHLPLHRSAPLCLALCAIRLPTPFCPAPPPEGRSEPGKVHSLLSVLIYTTLQLLTPRSASLSVSLCVPLVYPRLFALHHLLKDAANQVNDTSLHRSAHHVTSSCTALHASLLALHASLLALHASLLALHASLLALHASLLALHASCLPAPLRPAPPPLLLTSFPRVFPCRPPCLSREQQKQQNGTEEEQQHEHLPSALPLSSEKLEPDGVFLVENGEEAVVWVGREADSHLLFDLFGLRSVDEIAPGPFLLQEFDNPASRKLNAIVNEIRRQRCSYLRLRLLKRGDPSENLFFQTLVEDRSPSGMSYVEFLVYVHRQIQNKMG
ncbi:unnamed protein product [Closterium sp. NIES-53]